MGTDEVERDLELGPGRRRRLWAAGAMVPLLVAAATVMNRDHRTDATPPTATTDAGTAVPDMSATNAKESATTVSVAPLGPMALGEPSGLVVFVAVGTPDGAALYSMDLDAGAVRELTDIVIGGNPPGVAGDAVAVLTRGGIVAAHPDGVLQDLGRGDGAGNHGYLAALDTGRPDAIWRVTHVDDNVPTRAEFVTVAGGVEETFLVPTGFAVLAGDGVGGLLVESADDKMWRLPPRSDRLVRLDIARPMAVSHSRVATVGCDDRFVCGVEIVDVASGDRRTVPGTLQPGSAAALSADGSRLAQYVDRGDPSNGVLSVVDTETGVTLLQQTEVVEPSGVPQWSPGGRWLFWSDGRGLEVWDSATGHAPRTLAPPRAGSGAVTVVGVVAADR